MATKPLIARAKRGPYDELETPPEALVQLLPHLPKRAVLWESSPISWAEDPTEEPRSTLSDELEKNGFPVIMGNQDFFVSDPGKDQYDIQVTNPPFSIKHKWRKVLNINHR